MSADAFRVALAFAIGAGGGFYVITGQIKFAVAVFSGLMLGFSISNTFRGGRS